MELVLPSLYAEPEQLHELPTSKVYQVTGYLFSVNLVVVDMKFDRRIFFHLF